MSKFILSVNLFTRTISSLSLIALILYIILAKIELFSSIIIFVVTFASFEWQNITKCNGKLQILGLFLIISSGVSMLYIAGDKSILLWFLMVIWSNDIGAYLFGKKFGKSKLVPQISPNKTWAGSLGGIIAALSVAIILTIVTDLKIRYLLYTPAISILSQLGDLLESCVKRSFMVKHSGKIIPGHGGILDRIDGMLIAAPAVALLISLSSGN